MPAFFSSRRGYVVAVPLTAGAGPAGAIGPATVQVQTAANLNIGLGSRDDPAARTIITEFGVVQGGNYQATSMLDKSLFVYIFGDQVGEMRVSGLCFAYLCNPVDDLRNPQETGLQKIFRLYNTHKLTSSGQKLQIAIGPRLVLSGLLHNMSLEITDAEHNMAQWSMRFLKFPG